MENNAHQSIYQKNMMKRNAKVFFCAFISVLALVGNNTTPENTVLGLNENVYFSSTINAINPLTVFLAKFQNVYSTDSILPIVAFVALIFFYKKNMDCVSKYKTSYLLAVIFSGFFVIGKSYALYGGDDLICANAFQVFYSLISVLGLSILIYHTICFAQQKIDQYYMNKKKNNVSLKLCCLIIAAGWFPFIVAYFPGAIPWDPMLQIRQYIGVDVWSNHFPMFTTLLMGWGYSVGTVFGDGLGLFFYMIFQIVVGLVSFTLVCKKLMEWDIPSKYIYLTVAFYAINPIWCSAEASTMKDYLFFPIFVIFLILYMEIVMRRDFGTKTLLAYIVCSLFLSLIRSEGVYIIIISSAFLVIIVNKIRNKIIIAVLCVVFFVGNSVYHHVLYEKGLEIEFDKREVNNAIFQCTARYINEYETELTEEEKEIIDNVLVYETIKTNYTPGFADPVKDTYRSPDRERWKKYLNLSIKCLIAHPKVYMDSIITGAYGYFLPGYNYPTKEVYFLYIRQFDGDPTFEFAFNDEIRSVFESYINLWKNGAISSWVFSAGIYTWILLWSCWNLLRKKQILALVGVVPPLLVLGVCCISPITGLLRYALPYIAATPLTIAYSIKQSNYNKKQTA